MRTMKTVKISEFKAKCIRILKTVARVRKPVIVTLRGVPIARVEPVDDPNRTRRLGALKGAMEIRGDIVRSDFADDWGDSVE